MPTTKKNSLQILSEINRVLKPKGLFYSRTFSDEMYTGKTQKKHDTFEYSDISDGPFADKGFIRLIDKDGINEIYGGYFSLKSIDNIDYTSNNGTFRISEWVIISEKK